MFGQGIIGSNENVPQWILNLVERVEAAYGFCTSNIYFQESKSHYRGGCYRHRERSIQLYFGREQTNERMWIVLHELAHAWQHLERPDTLTPKPKGRKNRVVHNQAFFEFAASLYKEFGAGEVLAYAFKHEYKRGRKYMI